MKIVVLVKQVPDSGGERRLEPTAGRIERSPDESVFDEVGERALETALQYRDAEGAEVLVLTMGPPQAEDVLRRGLAMGADAAVHLVDETLAGADLVLTARVLARALDEVGFDLVIAGNESTDGRGGVLPAMLAELLGVAHVTSVDDPRIGADLVGGARRTDDGLAEVRAPLPAVLSVTERAAAGRYPSFMGIRKAKKKPLSHLSLADLGFTDPAETGGGRTVVVETAPRPPRSAGIKIVDEGRAGRELAEFLAAEHLI